MSIEVRDYGVTKDGRQVKQYIMVNKQGMKAVLLNYGAVLAELYVPDKKGELQDVAWGYENIAGYEVNAPGFGSAIGRNANRICRKMMGRTISTAAIPAITAVCGRA